MSEPKKKPTTLRCPHCGAPTTWEGNPDRPFCSERCRLIDLGRWADEEYRVPAEPVAEEDLEKVVEFPKKTDKTKH
jgi:hypothetical protein